MLRHITYRQAAIALVFTSLWFVLGFLLLWSPVPGALGIHFMLLEAWLLLFFALLGLSGAILAAASVNGIFPPRAPKQVRYAQPAATPVQGRHGQTRGPKAQQRG
jgi:hypothetical protein